MRRRREGMCLLLALLLAIGSVAAVQAVTDETTTQARDGEMDSAEQTSETAIDKTQETETESETTGKIEAGERTAVLTVVSITGNELTYYEEETEAESESETSEDVSSEDETEIQTEQGETRASKSGEFEIEEATGQIPGQGDASSDAQQSSNMPDMSRMPNGTPPDLSQDGTGSAPDMSQMPGGGVPDFSQNENDASGNAPSQMQRSDGTPPDFRQNGPSTKTVYLPVPVVVHTDDGDRTFSIIEAGDQLQATIVTDEDGNETITELWLLGTGES